MKFTLSWLRDHLETTAPLDTILDTLTAVGLTVDKVENRAEALAPFTVCLIEEAEKHPNADRLKVCKVNTGTEVIQVVCGAPNARKGLKAVLARPGVVIPSTGQVLKVGNVRDVESQGMMCSATELLLGEESDGIIEVDASAPLGESYAKLLGLDDVLIDIDITPNRGDCLGVLGIARDLAATGVGTVKQCSGVAVKGSTAIIAPLLHCDTGACPHFTGRVLREVTNGPSPEWLRQKLQSVGMKSISTLVDITNYFSQDRARPLHVFDLDKIKGNIQVRLSTEGESFEALDDKTYTLNEGSTVICDDTGIIALGGIMGGKSTGCDDATTNVFLEAAFFDPIQIATTARPLGIISDARSRFERGVDPASTLPGLEAATAMILELCGGEASEIIEAGSPPTFNEPITLRPERVESLGGLKVTPKRAAEILTNLGFEVTGTDKLTATAPSWRFDIEREADLVEEILRVEGYDKIPSVPYGVRPEGKPLSPLQERRFSVRDRLAGRGLTEAVTWSFVSQRDAELFGGVPESLILLNPISQDLSVMRPSVLPHLLRAVEKNQNRGAESVSLFEVGPQYTDPTPEGQHMMVSGVRAGVFELGNWAEKTRPVDLYDAKGDALAVIDMDAQWERSAPAWYHPGRSATLKLGKQVIGYFGEFHPRIVKAFDLKGPVVGFEIFIDRLPLPKRKTTAKPKLELSSYQAVKRDFSIVVDESVPADTALRAAMKADSALIQDVTLFDVFDLGDGKKALGIRVTLQPKEHTLTDGEIKEVSEKIVKALQESTGGVLR